MVSRHSAMLDHLTYYGIPPVKGMREAIYTVRETIERRMEPTRWGAEYAPGYPAGGAKNSSAMPSGSRKLSPEP